MVEENNDTSFRALKIKNPFKNKLIIFNHYNIVYPQSYISKIFKIQAIYTYILNY